MPYPRCVTVREWCGGSMCTLSWQRCVSGSCRRKCTRASDCDAGGQGPWLCTDGLCELAPPPDPEPQDPADPNSGAGAGSGSGGTSTTDPGLFEACTTEANKDLDYAQRKCAEGQVCCRKPWATYAK